MRTLAPELEAALDSGNYSAYFTCKVYQNGNLYAEYQPLKFQLTGTTLALTVLGIIPQAQPISTVTVILERGIISAGAQYGAATSQFTVVNGFTRHYDSENIISEVTCALIPPMYLDIQTDGTYQQAIENFCAAIGKNAVFKDAADGFWQQQFFISGQGYTSTNARDFEAVLHQKLVYFCDNGAEEILFYYALDIPASTDYSLTAIIPPSYGTGYPLRRRFYALDEFNNPRTGGTATDPVYNLGFISSLDPLPSQYQHPQLFKSHPMPAHLKYQCGDYVNWNAGTLMPYPLNVVENFNKDASSLKWNVELAQLNYFTGASSGGLVEIVSELPQTAENGDLIYNTANNTFYVYVNGAWIAIGTGDLGTYAMLLENEDFLLLENDDILLQG